MNGTPSAVVTLILPRIISVTVTDDTVSVDLEDGRTIAVPIGWYPRLAHGTLAERTNVQISGAGYGMHWPNLDRRAPSGFRLGARAAEALEGAVLTHTRVMDTILTDTSGSEPNFPRIFSGVQPSE